MNCDREGQVKTGALIMGRSLIRARIGTRFHRIAQALGQALAQPFQRVDSTLLTIDGGVEGFERVLLKSEARLQFGDAFEIVHSQSSAGSAPVSRSASGTTVQGRRRRTSST